MNDVLVLRNNVIKLPGIIRVSINGSSVFDRLAALAGDKMEATKKLKDLSARKSLVIWYSRNTDGKDRYYISSNELVYCCDAIREDEEPGRSTLSVIAVTEKTFRDQTSSMRRGVFFDASYGVHVAVNLYRDRGKTHSWFDGVINDDSRLRTADSGPAIGMIIRKTREKAKEVRDYSEEDELNSAERYEPSDGLADMLELAEAYSRIEGSLEEAKAQTNKNNVYTGIDSLEQTGRNDRMMYRFFVDALDETIFRERSQITVYDKNGEKQNAEITALVREDDDSPVTAFDAMFREQVSIDNFPSVGNFEPTFNPVTMNVQLEAQRKIAEGTAAAEYMDDVLGQWKPKGFADNDFTELRKHLGEMEHPPNTSQQKAIEGGINSEDVFLVMGPPGTGKTTVIAEWIKYFVGQGMRVLVSSQNNKAVDNVLVKMLDEPQIDTIRVGSELKMQDNVKSFMFENKIAAIRKQVSEKAQGQLETIDKLFRDWNAYAGSLDELAASAGEEQAAHEKLVRHIRAAVAPKYRALQKHIEEYRKLCAEESDLISSMEYDKENLLDYEEKGFLSRMLGRSRNEETIMRINAGISRYRDLRARKQQMVDSYPILKKSYDQAYAAVMHDHYEEYKEVKSKTAETANALCGMPDAPEHNALGLFENVREMKVTDAQSAVRVQEAVRREIERGTAIRSTLAKWSHAVNSKQNYFLTEMLLDGVDLVGATCIGINSQQRFSNLKFDVTIIDEAGQIQVHNALVPMSVSNKLIMLGDHKQIPPIVDQELEEKCRELNIDGELLHKSLFEKMYENLPGDNKLMLDTQYRMPAAIAETISDWFYDGRYKTFERLQKSKSMIPALSDKPFVLIDTSEAGRERFEETTDSGGTYNKMEADIIERITAHLLAMPEFDQAEEDDGFSEVGIISAYKAQVSLIKKQLAGHIGADTAKEVVATLDSFQGQERNLIIYSFTRSSDASPGSARIGFLKELRRLNVAMTRCKKNLIMIGDFRFLSSCRRLRRDEDGELVLPGSERDFSNFIRKVRKDVEDGAGELVPYSEFMQRL